MGSAKSVARADNAVGCSQWNGIERDARMKNRQSAPDRSRRLAGANGGAGESEFDETATSERVAEAAFPSDQRRTGKCFRERRAFEPSGFERARAVTLQPDTPTGHGTAQW